MVDESHECFLCADEGSQAAAPREGRRCGQTGGIHSDHHQLAPRGPADRPAQTLNCLTRRSSLKLRCS